VSIVAIVAACLAVSTGPVSAGGSNWVFERDHYQPGDTVFVWAQIAWAHNPALGTPEDGPYHAYVVRMGSDPSATATIDDAAVPVGDVTVLLEPYAVGFGRFGPHHAELTFTVPNLPPGRYLLLQENDAGMSVGDLSGQSPFWIDAPVVHAAPTFTG
jgi:hypothetical protein